jgi:hypothetical protein
MYFEQKSSNDVKNNIFFHVQAIINNIHDPKPP